jgi:hypothetical protein
MNNSHQVSPSNFTLAQTLCKLTSLNMGGPSSDPIRCANQNNERKDPSRGICPGEAVKEKNPSRVSVIVVHVGLTSWLMVSLSPFL